MLQDMKMLFLFKSTTQSANLNKSVLQFSIFDSFPLDCAIIKSILLECVRLTVSANRNIWNKNFDPLIARTNKDGDAYPSLFAFTLFFLYIKTL